MVLPNYRAGGVGCRLCQSLGENCASFARASLARNAYAITRPRLWGRDRAVATVQLLEFCYSMGLRMKVAAMPQRLSCEFKVSAVPGGVQWWCK